MRAGVRELRYVGNAVIEDGGSWSGVDVQWKKVREQTKAMARAVLVTCQSSFMDNDFTKDCFGNKKSRDASNGVKKKIAREMKK